MQINSDAHIFCLLLLPGGIDAFKNCGYQEIKSDKCFTFQYVNRTKIRYSAQKSN